MVPGREDFRDRIEQFVLYFLAFANVFDMGGGFGLKYASYALCLLLLAVRRDELKIERPVFLVSLILFLLWPVFASLHGIANGAKIGTALQRMTAFIPALLVMPIVASSRNPRMLLDAIMRALLSLAIVIIVFFAALVIFPSSGILQAMTGALREGGHGYFGLRGLGSIVIPNVYFKATLYLVPACAWFLFRNKYLFSAICFIALVLAFSRAGVLLAAIVLFVYGFMLSPLRVRIGLACLLAALIYVLWLNAEFLHVGAVLDMYLDVLTGRGQSAGERTGHFRSIVELLSQDASALWIGQGAGVAFWSSGVNAFVTAVELDHLDAIRTFGLAWFMAFFAVVLHAAGFGMRLESREARGLRVAILLAFLAAGTNPVLINPLFCMLVVASYYFIARGRLTGRA
jgi:hypothetical protein